MESISLEMMGEAICLQTILRKTPRGVVMARKRRRKVLKQTRRKTKRPSKQRKVSPIISVSVDSKATDAPRQEESPEDAAEVAYDHFATGFNDGFNVGRDYESMKKIGAFSLNSMEIRAIVNVLGHEYIPVDDNGLIVRDILRRMTVYLGPEKV